MVESWFKLQMILIIYIYILYVIHGVNGDSMMIWPPEILTKNGSSLPWIECDQARDASSTTRWIFTRDWSHSLWFSDVQCSVSRFDPCTRDMPNQRVGAEWHQSEQHRPRKIPGSADIFDTRHATRCSLDIGCRAHLQRVSCFLKAHESYNWGEFTVRMVFVVPWNDVLTSRRFSRCLSENQLHFAKHSHVV